MKPSVPANSCADTSNTCQASTARMLEPAIGPISIVKEFDEIRTKLKQNENSSIYTTKYLNIVARLEVIILPQYCELKEKLKCMERKTNMNYDMVPSELEFSSDLHNARVSSTEQCNLFVF